MVEIYKMLDEISDIRKQIDTLETEIKHDRNILRDLSSIADGKIVNADVRFEREKSVSGHGNTFHSYNIHIDTICIALKHGIGNMVADREHLENKIKTLLSK